jgi:hypothetical protein
LNSGVIKTSNGYDGIGSDLWQFSTVANTWKWIGGTNYGNDIGMNPLEIVVSTPVGQGIYSSSAYPGSRQYHGLAAVPGYIYLFGGTQNGAPMNDLYVSLLSLPFTTHFRVLHTSLSLFDVDGYSVYQPVNLHG